MVNYQELYSQLDLQTGYDGKISYLKSEYPAIFIDYCKQHGLKEEMDKYIEDSLELRDAGADKYGQYIHGGVIPTID